MRQHAAQKDMTSRGTPAARRGKWLGLALMLLASVASGQILTRVASLEDAPLRGVWFTAVSADGRFLYAASRWAGAVTVYRTDVATGSRSFVEARFYAEDGIPDVAYPDELLLAPGGEHLYAVGNTGSVVVFARDEASGRLTFVQAVVGDATNGLTWIRAAALSPDGRHVYFEGREGLTVYARDVTSGRLTFLAVEPGGVPGLAYSIAVSADGRHVYRAGLGWIAGFERDSNSGELTLIDSFRGSRLPSISQALLFGPGERQLYALGGTTLSVLARDPASGRVSVRQHFEDPDGELGLLNGTWGAMDASGRFLYVTSRPTAREGALSVFSRDPDDGSVEFLEARVGPELEGAQHVTFTADGSRLLVAASDAEELLVLVRDESTGRIERVDSESSGAGGVTGLAGAFSVTVDPTHRHLYVTGLRDDQVVHFIKDPVTGAVEFVGTYSDGEGLRSTIASAISPNGSYLYVLGWRGIALYARDLDTGELDHLENFTPDDPGIGQLVAPWSMSFSPDGRHVTITSGSDSIVGAFGGVHVFSHDPLTGELSFVQNEPNPVAVDAAFSRDGRTVYVTSFLSDVLTVYERDPESGRLTPLQFLIDDPIGALGLRRPWGVEVSPDGRAVYVASDFEGQAAVTWFERDPESGMLHHVGILTVSELEGSEWPRGLAMAPDGRELYLTNRGTSILAVLARDPVTGGVRVSEIHRADDEGLAALASPMSLRVSPDGSRIYVASSGRRNALSVWRRNCVAGPDELCLHDGRFRVTADWRDAEGRTGAAQVVPVASETSGLLSFFDPGNWEVLLKVLDGCDLNSHYWVFAAATTDVGMTVRVVDTVAGVGQSYLNPVGQAAPAVNDTLAFATCALQE
ncbi:MAG: beta-propeller fold lactonase family protein [Acidobacteriota bacterium]